MAYSTPVAPAKYPGSAIATIITLNASALRRCQADPIGSAVTSRIRSSSAATMTISAGTIANPNRGWYEYDQNHVTKYGTINTTSKITVTRIPWDTCRHNGRAAHPISST